MAPCACTSAELLASPQTPSVPPFASPDEEDALLAWLRKDEARCELTVGEWDSA
jgi:hypothetical protein